MALCCKIEIDEHELTPLGRSEWWCDIVFVVSDRALGGYISFSLRLVDRQDEDGEGDCG